MFTGLETLELGRGDDFRVDLLLGSVICNFCFGFGVRVVEDDRVAGIMGCGRARKH